MNQAETLRAALKIASDPELIRPVTEAISLTLSRCAIWAERGDAVGAAALNSDAGNVIGLCLLLQQSGQPLPTGLQLPTSPTLDELAKLPAVAKAHHHEVETWTNLNLCDAPLPERLKAARALRVLEPNNPTWKRNHNAIEQAAVELWSGEVELCLRSNDARAISTLAKQVHAMAFLSADGQQLVHRLDDAMLDIAKSTARDTLSLIEDELHLAWAAMDAVRAERLIEQWRTLAESAGGSADMPLHGLLTWLAATKHQTANEQAAEHLVADLVRALDELEPVHGIERRYAAAMEADATIPPVVEIRVAHRIADERRARGRRYAVGAVAIIAIAAAIAVIIAIRQQSIDRARTIQHLSACISSALQSDRLPDALDCWSQATHAGLIEVPELAAHGPGIERAEQLLQRRRVAAEDSLARARSIFELESDSLPSIQSAIALLQSAQADLPDASLAARDLLLEHGLELRAGLLDQERSARMRELEPINSLLAHPNPLPADLAGWSKRLGHAKEASKALAAIRLRPAADEITTRQQITSLSHRASSLRELAADKIMRLKEGHIALEELSRIPTIESDWAERWDRLIAEYPDVIRSTDRSQWGLAAEAAAAAASVEDWRFRFPAIAEANLWSSEEAPDISLVGGAKTSLQSHLDAYQHRSPYRDVAKRLITLASAMQDLQFNDPLDHALEESGLMDLYRADTSDGYVYLKRVDHGWRRLESRQDLKVPPSHLEPLSHESQRVMFAGVEPSPPAAVTALRRGLDAWKANRGPAGAAALIKAIEQSKEQDPLLVLAILRTIWETLRSPAMPLPAGISEVGGHWLDTLSIPAPTAVGADWVKLAPNAHKAAQHEVRRQARHAPHNSPSSTDMLQAWHQETADLALNTTIRIIGGILRPRDSNVHRAEAKRADSSTNSAEVLIRTPRGWDFRAIDAGGDNADMAWPADMPHAPAIIFIEP